MSKKIWRPLNTYGLLAIACIAGSVLIYALLAIASANAEGASRLTIRNADGTTEVLDIEEADIIVDVASNATTQTTQAPDPTPTPPADSDGDGVSDDVDQCPNTRSGASVDGTGCESQVAVDQTGYCAGAPSHVSCDETGILDPIWTYRGVGEVIIRGNIVSYPFTTRDSEIDGGRFAVTSQNGYMIDGRAFGMWLSDTPGGPQVADRCGTYLLQARGGFYWSQNPTWKDNPKMCFIGTAQRTLYLNATTCEWDDDLTYCVGPYDDYFKFKLRHEYVRH